MQGLIDAAVMIIAMIVPTLDAKLFKKPVHGFSACHGVNRR
jgi:hypothetical protein